MSRIVSAQHLILTDFISRTFYKLFLCIHMPKAHVTLVTCKIEISRSHSASVVCRCKRQGWIRMKFFEKRYESLWIMNVWWLSSTLWIQCWLAVTRSILILENFHTINIWEFADVNKTPKSGWKILSESVRSRFACCCVSHDRAETRWLKRRALENEFFPPR